ncbi:MAG: hypothetical protein KKB50_11515 [Planctomycetes bacterium]|nr:hypothetical protein [Planctomycetota bacterium]
MIRAAACVTALLAGCALLGGCGAAERERSGAAPLLVFGRTGLGPGEFSYPRAAAAAAGHRLYVVDKAGRLQCFTQEGQPLNAWRMPEIQAGKPTGLGIGPDGSVYVADTHYSRVLIFDPAGLLMGSFGSAGSGPGQFALPTDVAIAADGTIYVSEYGNQRDRVSKFTAERRFVCSFGGPDDEAVRLARPQSLLVDRANTLWVADACNHRICRFDSAGRLLSTFGRLGSEPGELRFPYNVDMLSDGTLVVCEYGNNRVQRFDAAGRCLGVWGRAGREPGQLAYPWALAVGDDDRVMIVDSGNNRVQVIAGLSRRTWERP